MNKSTPDRGPFGRKAPEEVRKHLRAARQEMREGIRALLPPDFLEHRRLARKEMLLAWRSMIDAALQRFDEKEEED